MTSYIFRKEKYFKEAKNVYKNYPTDVSDMEHILEKMLKSTPEASSFRKKVWIYQVAAERADASSLPLTYLLNFQYRASQQQ